MESQLQRAKFEGLEAVQGLLKTSLGDTSKHIFYDLYPIDKKLLTEYSEKILRIFML